MTSRMKFDDDCSVLLVEYDTQSRGDFLRWVQGSFEVASTAIGLDCGFRDVHVLWFFDFDLQCTSLLRVLGMETSCQCQESICSWALRMPRMRAHFEWICGVSLLH